MGVLHEFHSESLIVYIQNARYEIFRVTFKMDTRPPIQDALLLHTKRWNYQTGIHRRCLQTAINAPSPQEHGWQVTTNAIDIIWNTLPTAPDSILKAVYCSCKNQAVLMSSVLAMLTTLYAQN